MSIPAMVALVARPGALPCVVNLTARSGLSVKATSWCGSEYNAADGVRQMPAVTPCCPRCNAALEAYVKAILPPTPAPSSAS